MTGSSLKTAVNLTVNSTISAQNKHPNNEHIDIKTELNSPTFPSLSFGALWQTENGFLITRKCRGINQK